MRRRIARTRATSSAAERLRHVVVPAQGQPSHLVLGGVSGGREQDRDLHALGGEAAGHLEAVEVGKHHVENEQVGAEALQGRTDGPPVVGNLDLEPLVAKSHGDEVGDVVLVVDDEDASSIRVHGHKRRRGAYETPEDSL